jgi:Lon protease-like protein
VQFFELTSSIPPVSSNVREMPLFLLGGAFFPNGNTFLHVFEMKYRTMMFDLSQSDDVFGYIHSDGGQIASIGTTCKVTQRQLLDDGRQYIELVGTGRFRIRKITRTLPYIMAEVEPITDESPEDMSAAVALEKQVYDNLKYYMRLMRSFNPNKDVVISQKAKQFAPTKSASKMDNSRRTDFSFSLANMIQMASARESQLLLQTVDVMKRLEAQRMILTQAADVIGDQAIKAGVISESIREEIKNSSFMDDYDDDILPKQESPDIVPVEKDPWDINNIE